MFRKIIYLMILSGLLSSCNNSGLVAPAPTIEATFIVASSVAPTATPMHEVLVSPSATSSVIGTGTVIVPGIGEITSTPPIGTPTGETATPPTPDTIIFTTTSGEKVTMPEFTGDNAVADALQYVADHSMWVSGDVNTTEWATTKNSKNMKNAKILKNLPGFAIVGGDYIESIVAGKSYTKIMCLKLGHGTVIIFQDQNKDIQDIFLDGVDAGKLYNDLQSGKVHIPAPQPTAKP